jgi:hypothetical protein
MELMNFEKYGHLLKNPFVLIGFLALILLLIIKQSHSKIYDATDIVIGFLVILGIVSILAFIDKFFNKPPKPEKYYYVVAVFKTNKELVARRTRQELVAKGFSDIDYIYSNYSGALTT